MSHTAEGLPSAGPDRVEYQLGEEIDNIVPSRGYDLLPIIGLGGSAGGIPALRSFFETMPADSGLAFVVVLHLAAEHESILAELLQRTTAMRVTQVHAKEKVEANTVYVIPPGKSLASIDGFLTLADLTPERGKRVAVDLFFRSLADSHGAHATAIVLSGADGDGAIGIKRIKERGGLTIAQDPQEAEHSGMPRSAIATGMVDWVLRVGEIPGRVVDYYAREGRLKVPPEEGPQPAGVLPLSADEREAALRDVLNYLRTRTGRDFSYYKRATILRRVARRMQVNGVEDMVGYLTYLRTHPGEAGALLQDLLISVTNFFRDREVFDELETRIPLMFRGKGPGDAVRVWVAACATGEEAYSIAMLMAEHARTLDAPPSIQIFATDLDEEVIQSAREGVYPDAIAADVSEDRLRRFFLKEHRGYRVRRELREIVLFAVHDLLKDSPFSRLDFVSCRNLLIYLSRDAQSRALDIFHFALEPEGWLLLGTSESADDSSPLFAVADKKRRLYRRRATPRVALPIPAGPSTLARALEAQERAKDAAVVTRRTLGVPGAMTRAAGAAPEAGIPGGHTWADIHFKLIELYAPPSVLVNADFEIVHLSETAGRFLQMNSGEPSRNLLRLVHPMLRIELRAALYRAAHAEGSAEVYAVPVELEGALQNVSIRIHSAADVAPELLLVVFDLHAGPVADADRAARPAQADAEPLSRQLERDLDRMKAHLRDTVEQYEASTEELKASNEELQAMNEELRSATEELETSREELQSINEELTTVNQELKVKVDELGQANSDLFNLMASTAIATVFLDRDLRIMRYTPSAVGLFNLIPTDVGRPLSDLRNQLDYPNLRGDALKVLETLIPIELDVGRSGGAWYLARLLPYRTMEDRIDGVVLTFVDITARRNAELARTQSESDFRAIFELSSVGMSQADPVTHRFVQVNAKLCELLGYSERELLDKTIEELTHPDDRAPNVEGLGRLYRGEVAEATFEKRLIRKDGSILWGHVNVTLFRDPSGEPVYMMAVILDMTRRTEAEEALRRSEERLREANAGLDRRVRERTAELAAGEQKFQAVAATAGRRADQLRELATQLTQAAQKERGRLARILHDHVQQILVAAKMQIDMLRDDLPGADQRKRLESVTAMINDSINIARSLSVELVPPLLHDQGLPAALKWLARRMADQHRLAVTVEAGPDTTPPDEERRDIMFQAARELLLNVIKHAKTDEAWVTLERIDGHIRMEVVDHGAGCEAQRDADTPKSFGLFHIRERLESLGGSFTFESHPGEGTRAVVLL